MPPIKPVNNLTPGQATVLGAGILVLLLKGQLLFFGRLQRELVPRISFLIIARGTLAYVRVGIEKESRYEERKKFDLNLGWKSGTFPRHDPHLRVAPLCGNRLLVDWQR